MRNRVWPTFILATASLAFLGASLFLPVADSGGIFDFVPGILLLILGLCGVASLGTIPFFLLCGVAYLCAPLSCFAAIWSRKLAAIVAALSFSLPVYLLATEGLLIRNRHTGEKILAGGILCLFVASASMLGAWALAAGWFQVRRQCPVVSVQE